MLVTLAKLLLAGAALAAVCFGGQWLFFRTLAEQRIWQKALEIALTISAAAAAFFGAAYLLRVTELRDVVTLAKRKLGR
jgi:hypothetical protein